MTTVQRAPAGKPTAYRGHWIVPMSEVVERQIGRDARTRQQPRLRYDVLAPKTPAPGDAPPDAPPDTPPDIAPEAAPNAAELRKTCASLISAKGWIDTFGAQEPMR